MPAVAAPSTVLVTGANGFIAVATVKTLIERGFKVIGTVRTAAKGESSMQDGWVCTNLIISWVCRTVY